MENNANYKSGFVALIGRPIRWFISVDFPTFGRPIRATKPDL